MDHRWEQKRQSLPGTRRTDSYGVSALEGHGPTLRLDGGRRIEPALDDLRQNVLRHGGLLEGQAWLGYVRPVHDDLFGGPPVGRVLVAPSRHVGMLDVKVLFKLDEVRLGKVDVMQVGSEIGAPPVSAASAHGSAPSVSAAPPSVATAAAPSVAATTTTIAAATIAVTGNTEEKHGSDEIRCVGGMVRRGEKSHGKRMSW